MQVLIDRYIARLILWPLLATLAISAMLLLVVRMVELFSLLIDQGGTVATIFQVLSDLLPQYLALGLPVGLLMGVLLTFRKLTLARELDAILSSGVSDLRLLRVPLLYAFGLAVITFLVAGFLQPLSSYGYEKLRFDVAHGAMGIPVRVGEFTSLGDKLVIRAKEARRGGRELVGVFATTVDEAGRTIVLSAERAELLPAADRETVIARLVNGTMARVDRGTPEQSEMANVAGGANNTVGAFTTYDVSFKLPEFPIFRTRGNHEREMTLDELISIVRDSQATGNIVDQAKAGLYRRISQALVLFFLPFLGIALARPPLRSTSGAGIFAALGLFIVYNEVSLFAERLGFTSQAPPLPLQAGLLAAFGLLSLALFAMSAFRAGESLAGRLSGFARSLWDTVRGASPAVSST